MTWEEKLKVANAYFDEQLAIMAKYGDPADVKDSDRQRIVRKLAKMVKC